MFVARDPQTRVSTLYRMNSDGSELTALTAITAPTTPRIGVTIGGRYVYYTGKTGSELPLFAFDAEMRTQRSLSDVTAAFPTPSPRADRIAWFEVRGSATSLVIANADGSGRTVLIDSSNSGFSLRVVGAPAWSPDGSRIAVCGSVAGSSPAIVLPLLVDIATRATTVATTPRSVQHVHWLDANTLVYASTAGSKSTVHSYSIATNLEAILSELVPALTNSAISVSPTRETIVLASPLTFIDVATRSVSTLGVADAIIHDHMWSADGSELVYGLRTASQLYSERLFRVTRLGNAKPLPHVDSLGSSSAACYVRMP